MDTIPLRDRRAAALHRSFVIASLTRDVSAADPDVRQNVFAAPSSAGVSIGEVYRRNVASAPPDSFWFALEEPDRAVWRAVADASEASSPTYGRVSLMGHRDLGVSRVEHREVHGALCWVVTPLSAYPWRQVIVRPNSVHSFEPVPAGDAVATARATRRRAEALRAASAAERGQLADATAEIIASEAGAMPDQAFSPDRPEIEVKLLGAEGASVRGMFKGFARRLEEVLRLESPALGAKAFYPNRSRFDDEGRRIVLDLEPNPDTIRALAATLLEFGVKAVRMPAQFGGGSYVPPPADDSDPFADVAENHPDFEPLEEETDF